MAKDNQIQTKTMTVARGRTVRTPEKTYRSGESLTLPVEEAIRLSKAGFLVAPAAATAAAVVTSRPSVQATGGPTVNDLPGSGGASGGESASEA